MKKHIYVDIDETICKTPGKKNEARDYSKAKPIQKNIDKINKLYDEGNEITYYTSRGAETGIDWMIETSKQLAAWCCKHHALKMTKPAYDMIIDDKAKRIEEI